MTDNKSSHASQPQVDALKEKRKHPGARKILEDENHDIATAMSSSRADPVMG